MVRWSTRQRTASSMNFERSPFFIPCEPRKVRRVRSVSFETFDAPPDGLFLHDGTYTFKQINAYTSSIAPDGATGQLPWSHNLPLCHRRILLICQIYPSGRIIREV